MMRISAPRSSAPWIAVQRFMPIHRPHYSDPRFAGGRTHDLFVCDAGEGLSYDYSDRLWQWDYTKAQLSTDWTNRYHPWVRRGSPQWYEIYLSAYFGKPWLTLHHIVGGVNSSSGYEYFVFGYRTNDREEG